VQTQAASVRQVFYRRRMTERSGAPGSLISLGETLCDLLHRQGSLCVKETSRSSV